MHSRILVGLAFAYTLSAAAPVQSAAPILHLTESQIKEFKHADPHQEEPDIAFPKSVESLYAIADATEDGTLPIEIQADYFVDTSDGGEDDTAEQDTAEQDTAEEDVVEQDTAEEDVVEEDAVHEDATQDDPNEEDAKQDEGTEGDDEGETAPAEEENEA